MAKRRNEWKAKQRNRAKWQSEETEQRSKVEKWSKEVKQINTDNIVVKVNGKYGVKTINGVEKIVTLDEIKKENIIIAKPGEKIAVDGEIIERKSTFRWIFYNWRK